MSLLTIRTPTNPRYRRLAGGPPALFCSSFCGNFLVHPARDALVLTDAYRYVSIILLAISNIGWFYHGFSPEGCSKYYLVAPVFKGEAFGNPAVPYPHLFLSNSNYNLPNHHRVSNMEHLPEIERGGDIPHRLGDRDRSSRDVLQLRFTHTRSEEWKVSSYGWLAWPAILLTLDRTAVPQETIRRAYPNGCFTSSPPSSMLPQ